MKFSNETVVASLAVIIGQAISQNSLVERVHPDKYSGIWKTLLASCDRHLSNKDESQKRVLRKYLMSQDFAEEFKKFIDEDSYELREELLYTDLPEEIINQINEYVQELQSILRPLLFLDPKSAYKEAIKKASPFYMAFMNENKEFLSGAVEETQIFINVLTILTAIQMSDLVTNMKTYELEMSSLMLNTFKTVVVMAMFLYMFREMDRLRL